MKRLFALLLTITLTFSGCAYHHEIVRTPEIPLYNQTVMFHNVRYIPLIRFCDYYNLDWDWDLALQKIEIKSSGNSLVFRPNSNFALVNEKIVELDHPIEYKEGIAYIPVKTALFVSEDVFKLIERPVPIKKWHEIRTIVIDPGHGGKDSGAMSRYGTEEKGIVLDISKRLKRYLEESGLMVYLTRESDKFIALNKRAEFANSKNADLFVSIHVNASRHSRAKGFEVYYLSEATDDTARALAAAENASLELEGRVNPTVWDLILSENRRESKELAYYICNVTSDSLDLRKRGVKGARFVVLSGAQMPAVLIEVGFITNRREEYNLKRSSFREEIAGAVSRSILAYKGEYERTNGFSR